MKEILREGLPELGVQPEEAALDRLEAYHGLLSQRNQVMNLTAIQGEEDTARLHFLDCAALLRHLPLKGRRLADVGSGAGFPGLVLAILEPEVQVTLLDSQQKRVAFQREVCQTLGLGNVTCLVGRAEEAGELRESFDVVASRAVARLNLLSELCLPLVKKGGLFAAMKGPAPEEELQEAGSALRRLGGGPGRVEKYSIPGAEAVHSLVLVAKVSPTPSGYPRRFALIKKQPL